MDYEFQLFEKIIHGNLSPIVDHQKNIENYISYLQERHGQCYNLTTATFKKNKNKFILQNRKSINSLHPLAKKNSNIQFDLFQNMPVNELSDDVCKSLNLRFEKVLSVSYSQQPNSTILHIREVLNWDEITFKEAKYYYYNDLLKEEVIRIKQTIKKEVFHFKSNEKTEHYIHKLQQALVNLCFQLMKLLNNKEHDIYEAAINFTNTDILNLTFISLEKLLRFFEKNYLNYIDQNIRIPCRSALFKIYNINDKLEVVKSTLLNSSINPALLQLIYMPFLRLNATRFEERLTYKDLIYHNCYLQAFYDEIKENNNSISESQINELLYKVNYNSFEIQCHKTTLIIKEIEMIENVPDKIVFLYHSLKIVNQRRCKVNIAFDTTLTSLKDQLTGWIEEEINYYTKKLRLRMREPGINLFTEEEKVKIEFGLTVAQLAFFYRLQSDVGIITHKTPNEIFRHISENCQTTNTSEISQSSIKNKYYNIDNSTIEILKQKTIEMLNQLKNLD